MLSKPETFDLRSNLDNLVQAMDRIAQGDLTREISIKSQGEFGKVALAHNRMIASLREKELALERSNTFLQNLIDSSVDGIIATDMTGNIIIFNQGAERMLGSNAEEVMGKVHITEIYPSGMAKEIMRKLRSPDYGGIGKLEKVEAKLIHKNGEEIPVFISAAIVYEQQEEIASVGIFTDLRDRKRLEEQLIRSEKISSLGGLAAGIAHELNQPLTGILTFTHLVLKQLNKDDRVRKDLEVIEREASRCARIIRGVLDFARERPPETVPCDLNELIKHILSLVERQALFLDIQIVRALDAHLPMGMVDPDHMEQLIMNLMLNAADGMARAGGTLWIRTSKVSDGFVELEVEDTGIGIAEEDLTQIFDPFFTTKDEKKGMGLGLAVTYSIVKAHRGEIQVQSQVGKGTKFSIRLSIRSEGE
jgi:PAS domain S-box-containing protein